MSKASKTKRILAIETSCDETAMAVVEANGKWPIANSRPKFKILADVIASQIETHRLYGGVVPSLAKREHLKNLPIVFEKIIGLRKGLNSGIKSLAETIDLVAVTIGPGLEPCLWTGLNFAKDLAKKLKVPLVGVNHLEGHIFSNWLPYSNVLKNLRISENKIIFPAIVLLVSGGHTMLVLMKSMRHWKVLGETRDDAVGEAFDKVAKMLGLPYPGGPEVESLAKKFKSLRFKSLKNIKFPRPMIYDKSYDFSFSGLKTSVLYYLRDHRGQMSNVKCRMSICASFQQAAIDVLVHKTMRAAKEFRAKSVLLCGGVANNKALQKKLKAESRKLKAEFFVPNTKLNTDNAVMIAAAAYFGKKYLINKPLPNLGL